MPDFRIGPEHFELEGRPFQILSGALHYFRVHPDLWADRIRKARQMGLNTIETYVAWNAHAPREGEFDLGGQLDLGRFLDEIAAQGMHAIVRPGPYICAEWANGGLPPWLFSSGERGIRCDEPGYLAAIETYMSQLAPVLVPRQIDRGGPIILVQIENEYGAYGDDARYLEKLVEINRASGLTVPFTTVDQPDPRMLENGSIPGLHRTASFGSRATERLAVLRAHQPTGPLMCSEFWDGWFDHWGAHHHTTTPEQSAEDLDAILSAGGSVNLYMFHGGTNFGFTNGANDKGVYQPIVTSYDYDAPLDESGNPTAKYWAFREVLARYAPIDLGSAPEVADPAPVVTAILDRSIPLAAIVDQLGPVEMHGRTPTMDALGMSSGFVLYRTEIAVAGPAVLEVDEVRDRALVSLDGAPVGVLARDHHDRRIALPTNARGMLELLVEEQGRVNYGPRIGEAKGLVGEVRLDGVPLRRWEVIPLPLDDLTVVEGALERAEPVTSGAIAGPSFARGTFVVDEVADLFLDTSNWGKGVAWVNGFPLGRYWSRGPQRSLYVPSPVVRQGANEVMIFELHAASRTVRSSPTAELGHTDF